MARRTATKGLNGPQGPINVTLPALWQPRSYQRDIAMAMPANPGTEQLHRNRLVCIWARRSGKDLTALALTAREMAHRKGLYVHIFPEYSQAKKNIWDGSDFSGIPFLSRFPSELILKKNETEAMVTLKALPGQHDYGKPGAEGSTWQLRGADDPSRLLGGNFIGVVFSEYAQMDPIVWTRFVQPVLAENGGWALFLYTPEGRNHGYDLYNMAKQNPDTWFCSMKTVDDTRRDAPGEDGSPCTPPEVIEQMRKEGTPEHIIQQEYYCSFSGFLHGTIYGDLMSQARKDGRITRAPCSSAYPVGTCWDIGRTDATAIWFYQRIGQTIYFVDYLEDTLKGADYYAKRLRELPYMFSRHILPHDARAKNFAATQSVEEFFQNTLGYRQVKVAERTPVQQGIDATRRMFSRFVFDETKCARGIECLEKYARRWNDQMRDYSGEPQHDEWSHGSDALRTGVQGGIDEALDFFGQESQIGSPEKQETYFPIFDEERGMIQ